MMRRLTLLILVLSLAVCGCTSAPPMVTAIPTITDTPQPTATRTHRPTITPLPTATITPTQQLEVLDTDGPWLVLPQEDGLISVNADGSGGVVTFGWIPLLISPSPRGRQVAVITTASRETLQGSALFLMNFPGGESTFLVPLTNDFTEPAEDGNPYQPNHESIRAVVEHPNLAWSPDGRMLAFIGAQDGESADLYVYSTVDDRVRRLTDTEAHEFAPSWSPDGQYIVTFAAESFGTGEGYDLAGGWAVRVSDGEREFLYGLPRDTREEKIIGWVNSRTFIVASVDEICGYHNLRSYHFLTQTTTPFEHGYFLEAWMAQSTGKVLFGITEDMIVNCDLDMEPGVYLVSPVDGSQVHAFGAYPDAAAWVPQVNAFLLVVGEELWSVDGETGEAAVLPSPFAGLPIVSPRGEHWGWALPGESGLAGLWLGEYGEMPVRLISEPVDGMIWSPLGDAVMYYQWEGDLPGLYLLPTLGSEPIWVQPYAASDSMFWVLP